MMDKSARRQKVGKEIDLLRKRHYVPCLGCCLTSRPLCSGKYPNKKCLNDLQKIRTNRNSASDSLAYSRRGHNE